LVGRLTKRGWLFVCAAALATAPVYWHFIYSQIGLLLAALVLTAYAWHLQGKQTLSCVMVATAGLLKVFPLVLLPWFLWRSEGSLQRRAVRATVTVAVIGLLVFFTGIPLWLEYAHRVLPWLSGDSLRTCNVSLAAYVAELGVAASGVSPVGDAARPWISMGTYAGLIFVALCYGVCLWGRRDPEAEFCLLCVAMLAGSIMTWIHGLVFLIFPVAVLGVRIARRPSWGGIALLATILVFLNDVATRGGPFLDRHRLLKVSFSDLPFFGLLGVGVFFAWELLGSPRPKVG
jgi:hypothetical protein